VGETELTLISEATVARLAAGSVLNVRKPYLVTPSAAELAKKKRIQIKEIAGGTRPAAGEAPQEAPARDELAGRIESTLLDAAATPDQVRALCREAVEVGFAGVCVNPIFVPVAAEALAGSQARVITVCGFPLGANRSEIKAAEARASEAQGAAEIDMVMPVGLLKAGTLVDVKRDVEAVRQALTQAGTVLKAIIEAPLLSDEEKVAACVLAAEAGADYVKSGTGFAGPATTADVALMRQAIGDRVEVKAAGGIRTRAQAEALIAAGASRIGTSSAAAVVSHSQP